MSKRKKDKVNVKEMVISILAVLILIVAVVGISYAVWNKSFMGTKENSLNTGYVSFTYAESNNNVISIENAVPMSDENGKKQTGSKNMFDFNVSANYKGVESIRYEVYTILIQSTLDPKYVKVYLTDQNDQVIEGYDKKEVPTYDTLANSLIEEGKTLYKGVLSSSGDSKNLRLRIWLSSSYDEAEVSKSFSFKVNVKGEV